MEPKQSAFLKVVEATLKGYSWNRLAIDTVIHPDFLKRHGWLYACELPYEKAKRFVIQYDPTDRENISEFMNRRETVFNDPPFLQKLVMIIPLDTIERVHNAHPNIWAPRAFERDRFGFPFWFSYRSYQYRDFFAPRVCLVHLIHGGLCVDVVRIVAAFLIQT